MTSIDVLINTPGFAIPLVATAFFWGYAIPGPTKNPDPVYRVLVLVVALLLAFEIAFHYYPEKIGLFSLFSVLYGAGSLTRIYKEKSDRDDT